MAQTKVGPTMINWAGSISTSEQTSARALIGVDDPMANVYNRIANAGMRVSQQNGTSAGTTDAYYPVDEFVYQASHDGTISVAQVASATPGGSPNRLRATVTGTDAAIAAGQYAFISTRIEGLRISDALFGSASANDLVLRFGVKAPQGTYCVAFLNSAQNRAYIREYTISGAEDDTDTTKTVTLPGDTSGTWLTTNGTGLIVRWMLAVGSTYQTTKDAWAAGTYWGTSSQYNFLQTNSDVFELFDVGLYLDPDSTGTAPTFVLPDYQHDLTVCKRYWQTGYHYQDAAVGASATASHVDFPVEMRAAPTLGSSGTSGSPTLDTSRTVGFRWYNSGGQSYGTWTANARL